MSGLGSRTSSVEILADGHMQHSSHRIKSKASVCIAASLRCKRLRGARPQLSLPSNRKRLLRGKTRRRMRRRRRRRKEERRGGREGEQGRHASICYGKVADILFYELSPCGDEGWCHGSSD